MRIIVDLQAAQSSASRNRGIGRYSLALASAMVKARGEHEIIIVLSGQFPDSISSIREYFKGILPYENIRVWDVLADVSYLNSSHATRREAMELVREAFLDNLKPDIVHVASFFEGFGDDAITSIGRFSQKIPTAVTLYDLIPLIYRKQYWRNPSFAAWYVEKLNYLRQAHLLLSISESSRGEGIEHLDFAPENIVNISTDADAHFSPIVMKEDMVYEIKRRYGLARPFIMYTGGIDWRKNIEGLIRAFALLPIGIRDSHQLVIVCSVQLVDRTRLEALAVEAGLKPGDMVLTGFVPEEDLTCLYSLCALFVFPSWHEGFGLPILEAMRCGAPAIGANTSSIPEVIGWAEALFDPHSDAAIAKAIERGLLDKEYRTELLRREGIQAKQFSWEESARRAISAFEKLHGNAPKKDTQQSDQRLKLAYISPLPPERSGISDYSAELLPHLSRYYDIEVVVAQEDVSNSWVKKNLMVRSTKWFMENEDHYDRVIYHFGNSHFHQHMFEMLEKIPGVVVLHDFFLSGIIAHMEQRDISHGCWQQELLAAHGSKAVNEWAQAKNKSDIIWKYPCSLSVVQNSLGVIAHSQSSKKLAAQWYGGGEDWAVIPHAREVHETASKEAARKRLGIGERDFVICTFGLMGPTKLNHRLLQAWLNSDLACDRTCHLVFVGENQQGAYGAELADQIQSSAAKDRIKITGWASMEDFRDYLASADAGVQLRTKSRGETSGTVLDCMSCGLATIVNANGSMADLSDAAVWKMPDEFSDDQLVEALETLWKESSQRSRLALAGQEEVRRNHNPEKCAEQYSMAIEDFYRKSEHGLYGVIATLSEHEWLKAASSEEKIKLARILSINHPATVGPRE
jgi:glycosyltransferase involved in cell wall biosynthesis